MYLGSQKSIFGAVSTRGKLNPHVPQPISLTISQNEKNDGQWWKTMQIPSNGFDTPTRLNTAWYWLLVLIWKQFNSIHFSSVSYMAMAALNNEADLSFYSTKSSQLQQKYQRLKLAFIIHPIDLHKSDTCCMELRAVERTCTWFSSF